MQRLDRMGLGESNPLIISDFGSLCTPPFVPEIQVPKDNSVRGSKLILDPLNQGMIPFDIGVNGDGHGSTGICLGLEIQ